MKFLSVLLTLAISTLVVKATNQDIPSMNEPVVESSVGESADDSSVTNAGLLSPPNTQGQESAPFDTPTKVK